MKKIMYYHFIKHWLVLIALFISCSYYAIAQRDQLLPIKIEENSIDSCLIFKEEQKNDSLHKRLIVAFRYNNGRILNGYHYKITGDLSQLENYKYDEKGNIIEETKHDIPKITIELYDTTSEWGKRLIKEMRFHNRHVKHIYTYDDTNNVLIKEEVFSASFDTPFLTEKNNTYNCYYHYNDSNWLEIKVEEWPYRNKDGVIETDTTLYFYNEKGLLIQKLIKSKEYNSIYNYSYNNYDKLIKEESFFGKSRNRYIFYYEYDSIMNNISIKKHDDEGVYANYTYKYRDTLLVEHSFRNKSGNHYEDEFYEYDTLGRIKMISNITLNGTKYITSGSSYIRKPIYDKSGNIKTEKKYWKRFFFKSFEGKTNFFYNSQGQVSYEKDFDENNKLLRTIVYEYNDKNQVVQATEFDKDSILVDTELCYYDSTGTKIARKLIEPDGKISLYQTYKYNDDGEEIGGVFFKKGRKEIIKDYIYNNNGTYKTIHIIEKNWNVIENEYLYRYEYY